MKTALVLGGSRGIGFACARELAASGHRVVLVARDAVRLEEARASIGEHARAVSGDLGRPEDLDRAFDFVESELGGCDVLINNHGGPPAGEVLSLGAEDWTTAFRTFALPVFHALRRAVPAMRARKFGRIVTIGSIAVKQPLDDLDLSNFVRAGLAAVHKTLSRRVAADGITVHMVCPGSILTDRSRTRIADRAAANGTTFEDALAASAARIPSRRLGAPEEVAALVAFLASERAGYLTGNVVQVDGGMYSGLD